MSVSFSFEVFPPKQRDGLAPLGETVTRLRHVEPIFVSVTYGAGGSDRQRSFDTIDTVRTTGVDVAGHLTCVGQSRDEILEIVDRYVALGVRRVVALRGDPIGGLDHAYEPHPHGFRTTSELVAAITERSDLEIAVSAYPELHPQSPSRQHDLALLADKVAAGADLAITQMFFDNERFLRHLDAVRATGIDVPIVPGIFPIHCFPAVARFAAKCGATIPADVAERFSGLDDDRRATHEIAADLAARQIAELADHGVEHVHLYTLNRAELALAVCERLGVTGGVAT